MKGDMSITSRKGLIGEAGVQRVLNWWFPDFEETGIGVTRSRSQGANDVGDLSSIPYVCIECKNHKNPNLNALIDNAKWKAGNSQRPIWFLTYKKAGVGEANAHNWHAATTVQGFIDGFKPKFAESGELLDVNDIESYVDEGFTLDFVSDAQYPGYDKSPLPWTFRVFFAGYKVGVEQKREDDFEALGGIDPKERIIPIIVHPRRGAEPGEWFVWTKVLGMALMLETVGLLPFDPAYYPEEDVDKLYIDGTMLVHRNIIRNYVLDPNKLKGA